MAYDVLDVCRYVINYSHLKNYGISNLKLQKILYFIQTYFLITENKKCFNEHIKAWDFGSVIPEAYREYKQFGGANIPEIKNYFIFSNNIWDIQTKTYTDNIIGSKDKHLIKDVIDKFANYSATDLADLIYHQTSWRDAYNNDYDNIITTESIKKYFSIK